MILVTGGTGFIGSHLMERLSARGERVRCLVRPKRQPRGLPQGIESVPGDLASGAGLEDALRDVDTVFHLAGVTKALKPADYHSGNVQATEVLARALQGRPIRLVHVSSLAAIGPSAGSAVSEDDPPCPLTEYGRTKLEAERIVRRLLPVAVIVRPPVVYGPRDTDVFQLLKSISRGLVIEIAGGERWFSAVYVEDLVDGLIAAAEAPNAAGRAYFIAHPDPVSWSGLAKTAASIMRKTPRVLRAPVALAHTVGYCAEVWSRITRTPGIVSRDKIREARCASWVCDTGRASTELKFVPPTPLDRGLAKTLAWYKEAGWIRY
jgi:nucleoside-diphosphate-sugar epimerase